jgi:carbon storage regulator
MLVLTRKNQESVVVGGPGGVECLLKVTVLGINGGKVRLGFEADAAIPVHRLEVWERLQAGGLPDSPEGPGVAGKKGHPHVE